MPRNRLLVMTLTSTLAACGSPQQAPRAGEVGEQVLPAATAIGFSNSATATWIEVVTEGAAAEGWLKTFNDPELEQIVEETLRNNRQLAAAGNNLDAAARFAGQARTALASAVAVVTGGQANEGSDAGNRDAGTTLDLPWEVDTRAGLGAAEAARRASRAEFEAARQSLVAQTARTWFLANEANLQLALSQQAIEIYERIFEIVEGRAAAGAASARDISLSRAELLAAKERQRHAIGALIPAVRGIAVLLGRYPSAELELPRDFVPQPASIPGGLPATLLERRPDLIAAERRVATAFQRIGATRAARLPALPLTAAGGSPSRELSDLVGVGSDFFSVGENFIALPNAGGELEAGQETALMHYGAIALRALSEVESGLAHEARLREREASLAAAADDTAQALSVARTRHDAGATDLLSLLQIQARALNSRIALIRIKNAGLAQRVSLHLALGGGFDVAEAGAAQ